MAISTLWVIINIHRPLFHNHHKINQQLVTTAMSKISTTTLLFTVLLLHLATTAISTHVRRASLSEQHPSPRFHVVRHESHDSLAEQHSSPRFHVVGHDSLAEQHSSPCSHLAGGSWAQGFQLGDHKPTLEKKIASQFINPRRPRKALIEIADKAVEFDRPANRYHKPTPEEKAPPRKALIEIASRFNKAAESARQASSDHKPTPEEKAPPRFRIKPVKPPNVDHKPTPEEKAPVEPTNVDHKPTPEEKVHVEPPNVDHKSTLEDIAPVQPPNVDHKPTLEEKAHVEPPNVYHKPTLEEIAPMKPPNVDHKPTLEEKAPVEPPNVDHKPKAPPRFRIKPIKPRYVPHLAKKPTAALPKRKTPGPPAYFHKLTAPAGPRRHLIRRAQNPHLIRRAQTPITPTPSPSPTVTAAPITSLFPSPTPTATTAGGKRWCVAKEDASAQVLQANIDYACKKGVDCKPIQKGGDCFDSTSLKLRASFVMNAFYNIHGRKNCHFGRSGVLTTTNPSYGNCTYIRSNFEVI